MPGTGATHRASSAASSRARRPDVHADDRGHRLSALPARQRLEPGRHLVGEVRRDADHPGRRPAERIASTGARRGPSRRSTDRLRRYVDGQDPRFSTPTSGRRATPPERRAATSTVSACPSSSSAPGTSASACGSSSRRRTQTAPRRGLRPLRRRPAGDRGAGTLRRAQCTRADPAEGQGSDPPGVARRGEFAGCTRSVRRGRVISQTPRAGARLVRGAKVNLVVSKGRKR